MVKKYMHENLKHTVKKHFAKKTTKKKSFTCEEGGAHP